MDLGRARKDGVVLGGDALRELAEGARGHPVQQMAIATLADEVGTHALSWARGPPAAPVWPALTAPTVPLPLWCEQFVHDAVESVAVCGYFAYVYAADGLWASVVPPERYEISRRQLRQWTVVKDPQRGPGEHESAIPRWGRRRPTLVLVDPPRADRVRSACVRCGDDSARYDQLEANLVARDQHNSTHTVYTSISKDLRNQNGSARQWFRSATADEAAGTRPHVDGNFDDLIKERAATVAALAQHTAYVQAPGAGRSLVGANQGLGAGAGKRVHAEHAISDGREYNTAPPLQSLADGKAELDRVYTNIMLAFHVPPQIFGRNINTERHAASNRLTESAVSMFWRRADLLRKIVGEALRTVTLLVDAKTYVAFRPPVVPGMVPVLAPALSPEFLSAFVSTTYGVPVSALRAPALAAALAATGDSPVEGADAAVIDEKGKADDVA